MHEQLILLAFLYFLIWFFEPEPNYQHLAASFFGSFVTFIFGTAGIFIYFWANRPEPEPEPEPWDFLGLVWESDDENFDYRDNDELFNVRNL